MTEVEKRQWFNKDKYEAIKVNHYNYCIDKFNLEITKKTKIEIPDFAKPKAKTKKAKLTDEAKRAKSRLYYQDNREKINDRHKLYYKINRAKLSIKKKEKVKTVKTVLDKIENVKLPRENGRVIW